MVCRRRDSPAQSGIGGITSVEELESEADLGGRVVNRGRVAELQRVLKESADVVNSELCDGEVIVIHERSSFPDGFAGLRDPLEMRGECIVASGSVIFHVAVDCLGGQPFAYVALVRVDPPLLCPSTASH